MQNSLLFRKETISYNDIQIKLFKSEKLNLKNLTRITRVNYTS